jgi:hypothetical protein
VSGFGASTTIGSDGPEGRQLIRPEPCFPLAEGLRTDRAETSQSCWKRQPERDCPNGDEPAVSPATRRRLVAFRGSSDASAGSDASSGAPAVVRALAGSWLPALRASSLVAWVASLPCTRTGSLVDGADTAALLLAAGLNLANRGADRAVAGARVLAAADGQPLPRWPA